MRQLGECSFLTVLYDPGPGIIESNFKGCREQITALGASPRRGLILYSPGPGLTSLSIESRFFNPNLLIIHEIITNKTNLYLGVDWQVNDRFTSYEPGPAATELLHNEICLTDFPKLVPAVLLMLLHVSKYLCTLELLVCLSRLVAKLNLKSSYTKIN